MSCEDGERRALAARCECAAKAQGRNAGACCWCCCCGGSPGLARREAAPGQWGVSRKSSERGDGQGAVGSRSGKQAASDGGAGGWGQQAQPFADSGRLSLMPRSCSRSSICCGSSVCACVGGRGAMRRRVRAHPAPAAAAAAAAAHVWQPRQARKQRLSLPAASPRPALLRREVEVLARSSKQVSATRAPRQTARSTPAPTCAGAATWRSSWWLGPGPSPCPGAVYGARARESSCRGAG